MIAETTDQLEDEDLDRVQGGKAKTTTFEVDHPIFSLEEAFLPTSGRPRID